MGLSKDFTRSASPRNRRRLGTWAVAAALLVGNLFLHKPISDVCDNLYATIGRVSYEWLTLLGLSALSVAGALVVLRRSAVVLRQRHVLACVVALAAITLVAQRELLVSNVELIHLPQFGLLAVLLLLGGLGPQATWIGATLGGVLDETYQGLVIYAHLPVSHFDLNDIVLNAIGAAWAVILSAAGTSSADTPPRPRRIGWLVVFAFVLAITCWWAPPRFQATDTFPYWRWGLRPAATGRQYHVMSASEAVAALALIWWLVAVSVRSRRRHPMTSATASIAAASFVLLCGACSPRASQVASRNAQPLATSAPLSPDACRAAPPGADRFIITFWCGPPLPEFSDERAAQIAAAGFNVVGPPCEGTMSAELNHRALDIAARHGLLLWINDWRLSQHYDLHPEWETRLIEAVADYSDSPALDGYFLVDEPSADRFDDLAKVVARLQTADTRRLPYINLAPDFVPAATLGTSTYREHVERFMRTVRPPLLSFDYYPFKQETDRGSFFDNLSLVRDVALEHGVPFLLIVQAMPHGPYRDPTEAEIAWQVNHALAFGARGISYFAYWTPVRVEAAERMRFRNGLIENGAPTEHYAQAARINVHTRAIAAGLDGLRSIAVVDSQGRFGVGLPLGPLVGLDGGPITAGVFGGGGTIATLLVNQDYQREQRVVPRWAADAAVPEIFDAKARLWRRFDGASITLEPGGAALLRWTGAT